MVGNFTEKGEVVRRARDATLCASLVNSALAAEPTSVAVAVASCEATFY